MKVREKIFEWTNDVVEKHKTIRYSFRHASTEFTEDIFEAKRPSFFWCGQTYLLLTLESLDNLGEESIKVFT